MSDNIKLKLSLGVVELRVLVIITQIKQKNNKITICVSPEKKKQREEKKNVAAVFHDSVLGGAVNVVHTADKMFDGVCGDDGGDGNGR
jgi:hypothetical protein